MITLDDERQLLQAASKAFEAATGLTFHMDRAQPSYGRTHADFLLHLRSPHRNEVRFVAECKQSIDRSAALTAVRAQLAEMSLLGRPLLVTTHVSPQLAQRCRSLDLNFIDAAGNAYISTEEILIFLSGSRSPEGLGLPKRSRVSAAALRVVFVLVTNPSLLHASYRELSSAAGVSLGAIGPVLKDLQKRHFLSGMDRRRERHLLDIDRLRSEWAFNYPHRLRPQLKPIRFMADDPYWWRREETPADFLWSGEVAESMTSGVLRPSTQTLYVRPGKMKAEVIKRLVKAYKLHRHPNGSVEILDCFWSFEDEPAMAAIVPPLLVHADLLGLYDPRAIEAAAAFERKFLHGQSDRPYWKAYSGFHS